jgi:NAD(P)H-nitrite reductase large subunit
MSLKENCLNFRYIDKDITGIGAGRDRKFMKMPNCMKNKMVIGGCSEDCTYYESTI